MIRKIARWLALGIVILYSYCIPEEYSFDRNVACLIIVFYVLPTLYIKSYKFAKFIAYLVKIELNNTINNNTINDNL